MNKKFEISSLFDVVEKDAKSDVLTIKGYANTVSKDRTGDIIVKEAWTQGGMDDYLKNPIILAFHDHSRPVGTTVDYNVTDKGLEIVAEISKAAGEVYNLIKDGVLKTFSVGFSIKDADYDKEADTFFIKDLDLYEISVVSVPANQDSTFSLAKSFSDVEEYNSFKKSFGKEVEEEKEDLTKGEEITSQDNILKEINMDKKELQEMMAKSATAALDSYKAEVAEKEANATAEATLKTIEMGKTQAEKVAAELESKIKADGDSYSKAISDMSDELKSAKEEMAAMQSSKMQFSEAGAGTPSSDELSKAFITAKILGKSLDQTEIGKQLIEKANRMDDGWEETWNSTVLQGIQDRTVVEPLFQTIAMSSRVATFPMPTDTSNATWVTTGNLSDGSAAGTAFDDNASGSRQQTGVSDIVLTAGKLATREYIGYEEEEDVLASIAGIVQDSMVRRMARSSDASILTTTANSGFTGVAGSSASGTITAGAGGNAAVALVTAAGAATSVLGALATSANIASARAAMGKWGISPSDLAVIMSPEAYYNLMEDTNLITVDKYGDNALIKSGELGKIFGMSVVVSDAFDAHAEHSAQAVVVNTTNYLLGTYKGLTIETATDVVAQQKALVATRRFGFTAKEAGTATFASTATIFTGATGS